MPSTPSPVARLTSAWTWAARWTGSPSSAAMAEAFMVSVIVGNTLMSAARNESITAWSPAPAWPTIVVAPVAWYQNGEAVPHRSPFVVAASSAWRIVQYGSQPETIRRGTVSATDGGADPTIPDVTRATAPRAATVRRRNGNDRVIPGASWAFGDSCDGSTDSGRVGIQRSDPTRRFDRNLRTMGRD